MADRYCSNCRAELPDGADSCPECGVYAGDLYDERVHRPKTRWKPFAALLTLALIAGGAAVWWNARQALPERKAPPAAETSTRVVGDRPGGARRAPGAQLTVPEAVRLARRHVVETRGVRAECVAILGQGFRNGAYVVNAHDRCAGTRLGKLRVDGQTGIVTPAR